MKTIIVATDFSETALNASFYAADMALAVNADLILFHVLSIPMPVSEIPVPVDIDRQQQDAEQNINDLRKKLAWRVNNKVEITTAITAGTFYNELKQLCDEFHPYAVVMGSQGTTALERALFGGHAVYTMKYLPWPVITVPKNAGYFRANTIGLACDFKNVTGTIPAQQLKSLVKDLNAELHILNTGKQKDYDPDIVFESALVQELLNEVNPKYDLLTGDDTDKAILDFAEKNKLDLLIVLPKRHGVIDRMLHHSHTRHFVLYSGLPVMALHSEEA